MNISLRWLNSYLLPADLSADEAEDVLTHAGFPIESRTATPDGDTVLDVEVTSNRPDVLSHVGCAREIAASPRARSARTLVPPAFAEAASAGGAPGPLALDNRVSALCPLFTARVFTGCRVGPSPAWLVRAIEAVGQRSINNVVDITNFVTLELGNPCHVFDLARLAGPRLVVRHAAEGEKLRTLDGKDRTLKAADLVVADAERAQSLAGVIGGADSEVTERTTDVVLEMATWDPVTVRTQARRLAITTHAGYLFQRRVHPRTIDLAARRAAALIAELTGGRVAGGVLSAGAAPPPTRVVEMRTSRARLVLGIETPVGDIIRMFRALEIGVSQADENTLRCEIPPHRDADLTREIDLIEEVARVGGYDRVPVADKLPVTVRAAQPHRRALGEVGRVLTGLGFHETVTFSFTSPKRADAFVPTGLARVDVDDARRGEEPTLRPSVLAGLLGCRRANEDARSAPAGGVRLYEIAAAFAQREPRQSVERQTLALLADVPGAEGAAKRTHDDRQQGLRIVRGAVDALVRAMHGPTAEVRVEPAGPAHPVPSAAWDAAATGLLSLRASRGAEPEVLGVFGMLTPATLAAFGLDTPVVAAELDVAALVRGFPPRSLAHELPSFPAIERDLSLVVEEGGRWADLEGAVGGLSLAGLEAVSYVGVYRGKPLAAGKKSVTVRLRFRDLGRTLRHDEVDPQVSMVVGEARKRFQAELRA